MEIERHRIPLVLDSQLDNTKTDLLKGWLERLEKHEPIQYVLGYAPFLDMKLIVNEQVLIPRPETEELVMMVVNWCNKNLELSENPKIIDLGTGSGCIPIGIKKMLPNAKVTATDLSPGTLEVARENAKKYGLQIDFLEQDILSTSPEALPEFDVLVSNPPYVLQSDKSDMQKNVVEYEPWMALFPDGDDSLVFYRKIFELFNSKGTAGKGLFLEIHESKGQELMDLARSYGWREMEILKDLQGKDRFMVAKY